MIDPVVVQTPAEREVFERLVAEGHPVDLNGHRQSTPSAHEMAEMALHHRNFAAISAIVEYLPSDEDLAEEDPVAMAAVFLAALKKIRQIVG